MEQNIELTETKSLSGEKKTIYVNVNVHDSEKKLIDIMRSIENGEISTVKIQNGLPVFYIINLKDRRFV